MCLAHLMGERRMSFWVCDRGGGPLKVGRMLERGPGLSGDSASF